MRTILRTMTAASASKTNETFPGLGLLTEWQTKVIDANRDLRDAVKPLFASLPLASLPTPALDFSLVEKSFQATSDVLEANRRFTNDLLAIWLPKASTKS